MAQGSSPKVQRRGGNRQIGIENWDSGKRWDCG
jgi:hypothetical protein